LRLVLDQIQGNLAKSTFFSFFGNYVGQNRLVFAPCSLFFRIMNKKQVDYVVLGVYWMGKMDWRILPFLSLFLLFLPVFYLFLGFFTCFSSQ